MCTSDKRRKMDIVGSEGEQQFTPAILQDASDRHHARQHC